MISATERRALRARSHALKPVVLFGQHGLTPAVIAAIDEALTAHELIKIRIRGVAREARESTIREITDGMQAQVVNVIGHILTLFRARPEPLTPAVAPRKKKPARRVAPPRAVPRTSDKPRRAAAPRKSPVRRGPK